MIIIEEGMEQKKHCGRLERLPSFLFLARVQKEEPFLRDALSKKKDGRRNIWWCTYSLRVDTPYIPAVFSPKFDHAIIVLESCKNVFFNLLYFYKHERRFSLAYFWHVKVVRREKN